MRLRTFLALLAVGACAALGLAACGGNDDNASAGAAATQTTTHMAMADADTMSAAADLRVTLDSLLGEHALLAVAATQKGFDGAADFEAAAAALDANSVELAEAIGSVYGRSRRAVPRRRQPLARPHRVLRGLHGGPGREGQGRPAGRRRQPDRLRAPSPASSPRRPDRRRTRSRKA